MAYSNYNNTSNPTGSQEMSPEELDMQVQETNPDASSDESLGANSIMLNRQVFDKAKFLETVDTEFSQLVDRSDLQFFDLNLATVEDFFNLYNKLFYEIPKEGEVNSHAFLAQESGEYVDFLKNNEEVQALIDEITELRQQNLDLVNEIAGIAAGTKALKEAQDEAQRQAAAADDLPTESD